VKVLVIGRFYEEGVASFVADELEALGHRALRHDPGPKLAAFGSRAAFYVNRVRQQVAAGLKAARAVLGVGKDNPALRALIRTSGGIDLVISTHDYLTPAEAQMVKAETKAPLALWFPDPVWSFRRHMFLNAPYDFLFFKDPYIVDLLRRNLGAHAFYLPECFSPRSLAEPVGASDPGYQADICTAGNLYAYRVAFFRNLAGRDVKIWGLPAPLWMDLGEVKPMVQNRFVAHGEKVRAFRGAKIVLNNLNPSEIWGTNVRTFEICGAGGFQIVDSRPGLSQLFEIGKELVTFGSAEDLKVKIDHYLAAPEERGAIAKAGRARAWAEHTYAHRLQLLLDTVGGRQQGFPAPRVEWA